MAGESRPQQERVARCPLCGRPAQERFRPFCSATCRDRDLLNWLDGRYAIPAQESEAADEEPREAEGGPAR